jgi:hypothetical protein
MKNPFEKAANDQAIKSLKQMLGNNYDGHLSVGECLDLTAVIKYLEGLNKRKFYNVGPYSENDQDQYATADGHSMKREFAGLSPNGNRFNGRWVLRNPAGEFMGYNDNRIDLANLHGFDLEM